MINLSLSYLVMVTGILIAKCLGFVRELVVASTFGTSSVTDIYFQVYAIANVVFAAMGVSLSTFVVKSINSNKNTDEKTFVGIFIKKALIYSFFGVIVLSFLAYPITKIILPGVSHNELLIAMKLYYIMIPSFVFIVLTYTQSGVLQNKSKFFLTSIVSLPFNLLIIGGLLLGCDNIYLFGVLTTLGWGTQCLFLMPSLVKNGYKFWGHGKEKINLMGINPMEIGFILISNLIFQLLFMIDKSFGSHNVGMSSAIHYSSNLFLTVSSVFLVAMSAVFFPSLTKSLKKNDSDKTNSLIRYTLIFMFAVFFPFLAIVGLYHKEIITLLYERGNFSSESTKMVSNAFFMYSFCIFGYITQELLFKIFYAKSKYLLTVLSAGVVLCANVIFDYIFKDDINMIILSTVIICGMFAAFMFFMLGKYANNLYNKQFFVSIVKIIFATLFYFISFWIFKSKIHVNKFYFILPILSGTIFYIATLYYTKILNILLQTKNSTV